MNQRRAHAEGRRDDLLDLGQQALTHFSATMIKVHTPIRVNMNKGAGLVKMRRGKGNTKLHGCKRKTATQIGLLGIELGNVLPALSIMGLLN